MAAPASAASSADVAICSGVIGRCGDCSGFVRLPVIAQVMMVLVGVMRTVPFRKTRHEHRTSSFSPCGRRWREAPDEGLSPRTQLTTAPADTTSPVSPLCGEPPSPTRSEGKKSLDDALLLQRLDLAGIVAKLAGEHLLGVLTEQRRGAVVLDRGFRERQRVADQREIGLEGMIDLHPHAARLDMRIGKHLIEMFYRT